ncbi:MAG: hypothetical protein OEX09_09910 [Candidatus Bathyarchaeota archaeon]|nr:hypothetical protein [Candidatus Bathyarchaeota archaeon]
MKVELTEEERCWLEETLTSILDEELQILLPRLRAREELLDEKPKLEDLPRRGRLAGTILKKIMQKKT